MTYVDRPDKKQLHPHFEHRARKLDLKNNEFSRSDFHDVRKVSTNKKLIKAFSRIGMCLNDKEINCINPNDLDKVCFLLINCYEDKRNDLGVGPLNDGYLVGLNHHRFGSKVFYLYDPKSEEFTKFLGFFLKYTQISLTVFYSGIYSDNSQSIDFVDNSLSKNEIGKVIADNCNGKARVMFITDCCDGGSIFDINSASKDNNGKALKMFSLYVNKSESSQSIKNKDSHGIFTYYLCKIIHERPDITPCNLIGRMVCNLKRFNETPVCEMTEKELNDKPIFESKVNK